MRILLRNKIPFFYPFDRFLVPSCCKDYFLEKFSDSVALQTCYVKVSVCICIGFSEFNKPAMCKIIFHIAIFSPLCCLYCLFEQSTAHNFILSKVCHFVGRLKHKYIFSNNKPVFRCF